MILKPVLEVVSTIKIVYITGKKNVNVKLSSGDGRSLRIIEKFDLEKLI